MVLKESNNTLTVTLQPKKSDTLHNPTTIITMNSKSSSVTSLFSSSNPKGSQKNYEQAFAGLSSSYGFSGGLVSAPILPTPPTRSQPKSKGQNVTEGRANPEAIFGKFARTYGFSGTAPSPIPRDV